MGYSEFLGLQPGEGKGLNPTYKFMASPKGTSPETEPPSRLGTCAVTHPPFFLTEIIAKSQHSA